MTPSYLLTAVTRGWNGYRNKSAQKVDPGEENSTAAPAGNRTRNLSIRVRRSNPRSETLDDFENFTKQEILSSRQQL